MILLYHNSPQIHTSIHVSLSIIIYLSSYSSMAIHPSIHPSIHPCIHPSNLFLFIYSKCIYLASRVELQVLVAVSYTSILSFPDEAYLKPSEE